MESGKEKERVYFVKNGIYGEDIDIDKCNVIVKGKISYIENKVVKRKSEYLIDTSNDINDNILEKISKYLCLNIDSVAYLKYDIEKKLKKDSVISSFRKIGKVKEEDLEYSILNDIDVLGDEKNRYNYRNKVSLKVKICRDKENIERVVFGYYKKKSNEIVEISDCILASDKINNVISVLNSNRHDKKLIEELSKNSITEIVIRDVEEGIAISPRIKRLEEILKNEGINIVSKQYDKTKKIGNTKYIIGEKSFFQVNKYNTEKLYNKIYEYVENIVKKEKEKEQGKENNQNSNVNESYSDNANNIRILDIYSGVRKHRNIC